MEEELKEWLEKYDEKVKSFGFTFRRIGDGGLIERVETCIWYKKPVENFNNWLMVFYDENEQKVLINLGIKPPIRRKRFKMFTHITTEEAFKILEEFKKLEENN